MGTRKGPRIAAKDRPRDVEVAHPSYQPSKAELEEDMRVNASFEEAVDALTRPVRMRYVKNPSQGEAPC